MLRVFDTEEEATTWANAHAWQNETNHPTRVAYFRTRWIDDDNWGVKGWIIIAIMDTPKEEEK